MTSERRNMHVSSNALQVFIALSIMGVLLEVLAPMLATGFAASFCWQQVRPCLVVP